MTIKHSTREAFLTTLAEEIISELILPEADNIKMDLPHGDVKVRVSTGFAKGSRGGAKRSIQGVCHPRSHSSDGYNEVFISPELTDTPTIVQVLTHELCHAVLDCHDGHKGRFAILMKAIGFIGRMTGSTAGPELLEALDYMAQQQGEYPAQHMVTTTNPNKQTTRMIKLECSSCGFTARTSRKWIDQLTTRATCPVCNNHTLNADV